MSDDLRRLAKRAASDPWFLGSVMAVYQLRHGLDDEALARELGCVPDVLTVLRLCRRPGAVPDRTAEEDVAAIAERFGVDAAALARIVKDAGTAAP